MVRSRIVRVTRLNGRVNAARGQTGGEALK